MRQALTLAALLAALLLVPASASAAETGTVLGTVTPVSIAPEVEVCLVEARPSETCTSPAADGSYALGGLPLGTPVRIEFLPSYRSHYVDQYYDDVPDLGEATTLTFSSSSSEAKGIDAALELGGDIEGAVTAASGGGALSEVEVCVLASGQRLSYGCTETNQAGEYALGSLPAGTYKVGFWGRGASAEYAPQYYEGQTTISQATPVTVAVGGTVSEIDAEMARGAKVNGTVVAASTGVPLEGVPVCLFGAIAVTPSQCVYTGAGGSYSIIGLAPGGYQVGFSLGSAEIGGEAVSAEDDAYLTQYYHGVANRSEAQVLDLSGEQVAGGIDAQLLTPSLAPPPLPPPPVTSNVTAAPVPIAEPVRTVPLKCKKGLVRRKDKGAPKCVKKKPTKKRRKHKTKSKHGKSKKTKPKKTKGSRERR